MNDLKRLAQSGGRTVHKHLNSVINDTKKDGVHKTLHFGEKRAVESNTKFR